VGSQFCHGRVTLVLASTCDHRQARNAPPCGLARQFCSEGVSTASQVSDTIRAYDGRKMAHRFFSGYACFAADDRERKAPVSIRECRGAFPFSILGTLIASPARQRHFTSLDHVDYHDRHSLCCQLALAFAAERA
jgi:hypothetical protein